MAMAPSRAPRSPEPIPAAPASMPAARPQSRAGLAHLFDMIFRFLASLKLAVICLGTLSATLAVGTWFNSQYGLNAANEYIYQTGWFAVLLGFLAANVFCAAAIRYPWKRRQTGFVITHVGLLIVIGGSWYAAQTSDEGMLKLIEGETSGQLIQQHKSVIFVRPVDPQTGKSRGEYKIPVRPGAFDWQRGRAEVVTKPEDPFRVTVKGFYAASMPRKVVVPGPGGRPMLQIRPTVVPPGETKPRDAIADEAARWFAVRGSRAGGPSTREIGPAQFRVFRSSRPEVMADFLDPPADPGLEGVARLHYIDRDGKPRRFDVRVDDARADAPIPLPDSDIVATYRRFRHDPIPSDQQALFGVDVLDAVDFAVRRGDGPSVTHTGYAGMADAPAVLPDRDHPDAEPPAPLVRIDYFCPPVVDPKVNRRYGVIDLMVEESGRMAYRVFERGNPGKLRGHGPIKVGENVTAFGGNSVAPMTLAFGVEKFLPSAREETIAESFSPEPNERDDALAAVLVELAVKGQTREVWLRKSADYTIDYKTVAFDDAIYELGFDAERLDLGFTLKLNDFDVTFDRGTDKAAAFRSEVSLDDPKASVKARPASIYMNHTLDHSGWRFFQSRYFPVIDPETGRKTGDFGSVLQVSKNPAREIIYLGCLVVVAGAFVQFYMRAGVFTDGGKRERERAAVAARRRLEAKPDRRNSRDRSPEGVGPEAIEPL